jgi:hypothetical protein
MNFRAFQFLAAQLITYRLDRSCWSVACDRRPPFNIQPSLIKQLLYPPKPDSSLAHSYKSEIDELRAQLAGTQK